MPHQHLALPAAILALLAADAHAQSAIQAATTGRILEARPGLTESARSSASVSGRASHHHSSLFVDPGSPRSMLWGSAVRADSLGWFSEQCAVQKTRDKTRDPGNGLPYWHCYTQQSDTPPWFSGSGPSAASAGGQLLYEDSIRFQPTSPREVRFRALDHSGASVEAAGSAGQSRLEEGRTTTQAWLRYTPPWAPAPGKPVCSGELVLELNYGVDGLHDPDPIGSIFAERWLDLDVRYGPNGNFPSDPRGTVAIRAAGQPSTVPRGTGWPTTALAPRIQQSTVHVDTSMGSRPADTFSWNNGVVAQPNVPFTQVFDTWSRRTIRVPVTLRVPMQFHLDALTHQRQYLSRSSFGRSSVPYTPNPAAKGNGVDVRMYLDNLQPQQCRPDYVPPRPPPTPPRGGCVPTPTVGCWFGTGG
jgi:hypothetical protein